MPILPRPLGIAAALLAACSLGARAQDTAKPTDPTQNATAPTPAATDGKTLIAPDIQEKALWDGRKIAPFKALDDPKMVKAAEADFLGDDDYVLGATVAGESRAYPTRFIWFHHVINDRVEGPGGKKTSFAVFYCSVC